MVTGWALMVIPFSRSKVHVIEKLLLHFSLGHSPG